jgi:hypothetical protein
VSLRPVMPIPLQTKLNIFEAQHEYYSNQRRLLDASYIYSLCFCAFIGKANTFVQSGRFSG